MTLEQHAICVVIAETVCEFQQFNRSEPRDIKLGDGHAVKSVGRGVVLLRISTDDGKTNKCELQDVLYVSKLSFNLLIVVASTKAGMLVQFTEGGCKFLLVTHGRENTP